MRFGTGLRRGKLCRNEAQYSDQRPPEGQQRADVGQVFQPRNRRLRAQFFARLQAVERQFGHRVAAQCVGIIAVFVTGSDHQHAEADDLGQAVLNLLRCARVVEEGCQAIGYTRRRSISRNPHKPPSGDSRPPAEAA